jgi:hypothetical protein
MKRLLTLLLTLAAGAAQASTFVGSRAALGGNDFIDWGTVGPSGTILSSPFNITSNNGLSAVVTGGKRRADQASTDFDGNFAPGDHLLVEPDIFGTITIDFATGIYGAGAQVETADPTSSYTFTGTIWAYDQSLNLLGMFNFNGVANSNADNSAVFAGVIDSSPDIYRLVFTANDQTGCANFLINRVDLVTMPVPEGGSLSLLLVGLGVLGLTVVRKRRAG